MNGTPKLPRKSGLSLSSRLNRKRHSESPKARLRSVQSPYFNCKTDFETPCSDGGVECTPPRKNLSSFDDSFEYSPKALDDNSFSPSYLQSQTLAIESAEVGWKWNGCSNAAKLAANKNKPACAASNSFSTLDSPNTKLSSGSDKTRPSYNVRREEERTKLELEIRKAEKKRADQKLQERCDKLREQLKGVNKQVPVENALAVKNLKQNSPIMVQGIEKASDSNNFDDFFNDSASDCLLIAATQEIENKKEYTIQKTLSECSMSSSCSKVQEDLNIRNSMSATPTTSKAEKRSSFYSKFLEDDFSDDLFLSLDERLLEAAQTITKTPKTPLQRYKSMPVDSLRKSDACYKLANTDQESVEKDNKNSDVIVSNTRSIQRHFSSHVLNSKHSRFSKRQQKED
uniref:Uncharacterized protein n=1 Tax=Glossina brevipalpis TaxID=37001 RepID=A0A1A9WSU5_9MUSC